MIPDSSVVIAPYKDIQYGLEKFSVTHVVSIIGPSDGLNWPDIGNRACLRLAFDDVGYSSGSLIAPNKLIIQRLIAFAKRWSGDGDLLVHCRAGTSRSPAAAMICVAALNRLELVPAIGGIMTAKPYFQPNRTMLRLADVVIKPCPGLVDVAKAKAIRNDSEDIGLAAIRLVNNPCVD